MIEVLHPVDGHRNFIFCFVSNVITPIIMVDAQKDHGFVILNVLDDV